MNEQANKDADLAIIQQQNQKMAVSQPSDERAASGVSAGEQITSALNNEGAVTPGGQNDIQHSRRGSADDALGPFREMDRKTHGAGMFSNVKPSMTIHLGDTSEFKTPSGNIQAPISDHRNIQAAAGHYVDINMQPQYTEQLDPGLNQTFLATQGNQLQGQIYTNNLQSSHYQQIQQRNSQFPVNRRGMLMFDQTEPTMPTYHDTTNRNQRHHIIDESIGGDGSSYPYQVQNRNQSSFGRFIPNQEDAPRFQQHQNQSQNQNDQQQQELSQQQQMQRQYDNMYIQQHSRHNDMSQQQQRPPQLQPNQIKTQQEQPFIQTHQTADHRRQNTGSPFAQSSLYGQIQHYANHPSGSTAMTPSGNVVAGSFQQQQNMQAGLDTMPLADLRRHHISQGMPNEVLASLSPAAQMIITRMIDQNTPHCSAAADDLIRLLSQMVFMNQVDGAQRDVIVALIRDIYQTQCIDCRGFGHTQTQCPNYNRVKAKVGNNDSSRSILNKAFSQMRDEYSTLWTGLRRNAASSSGLVPMTGAGPRISRRQIYNELQNFDPSQAPRYQPMIHQNIQDDQGNIVGSRQVMQDGEMVPRIQNHQEFYYNNRSHQISSQQQQLNPDVSQSNSQNAQVPIRSNQQTVNANQPQPSGNNPGQNQTPADRQQHQNPVSNDNNQQRTATSNETQIRGTNQTTAVNQNRRQ